jgi:hypothetical protein
MPTNFQYVPTSGDLSGKSFEEQTEKAFNELGSQIDIIEDTAGNAVDIASSALSAATDAVNTANNAITAADIALSAANAAQATADNALSSASAAQGTADNAQVTANNALDIASAASGIYEEISETGVDLDAYIIAVGRWHFTASDILNSPVPAPVYVTVFTDDKYTTVTQFAWNNDEEGAIYFRTGEISPPVIEDGPYTVVFSAWRTLGGGSTVPKFMIGWIVPVPFRASALPAGLYFCNGDQYAETSPQGKALLSLDSNMQADFGITLSGGQVNVPNMFASDGRGYSMRFVNGTSRLPGSAEEDKGRNITASVGGSGRENITSGSTFYNHAGAFYSLGGTVGAPGGTDNTGTKAILGFDASRIWGDAHTGSEFTMLNMGFTPAIILGV